MEKKIFIFLCVLFLNGGGNILAQETVNGICYYLITVEIKASIEESEKQEIMSALQATTLSNETVNENEWTKFKEVKTKINDRLNGVSLALQSLPTSLAITRSIMTTTEIQQMIFEEIEDAPLYLVTALEGQYDFLYDLQMNVRLIAGIILSYGTINQMESAERSLLLDYAESEFRSLVNTSRATLEAIRRSKTIIDREITSFSNWLVKDKGLVEDIINNAEILGGWD